MKEILKTSVTVGRKNRASEREGREGRKKSGRQKRGDMRSFLRKGAAIAHCNGL